MKRVLPTLLLALCLLCVSGAPALADEAGVLTEEELGAWLNRLLVSTVGVQPSNAPVGQESLTEDGYAFLYPQATLYYDKPELDAASRLTAVAVTDEALDMPRGIRLGAPAEMLMAAYGWQNPTLAGDDSSAPLYTLDQLPQAAYWAWAQRAGDALLSVQCGIHAGMGEGRYTDTGVIYTVAGGVVTSIRIYGLRATTDLAGALANLNAVRGGAKATGVTVPSAAQPFAASDLQFDRMDFLTLNEKGAAVLLGSPASEQWAQEDGGRWLHTLTYERAMLVFSLDQNRENGRLDTLVLRGDGFTGPRGLQAGMTADAALALFQADGKGRVSGGAALLYGDGQTPPFGTLERDTGASAILRYAAALPDGGAVALHLAFKNGALSELTIYRY